LKALFHSYDLVVGNAKYDEIDQRQQGNTADKTMIILDTLIKNGGQLQW